MKLLQTITLAGVLALSVYAPQVRAEEPMEILNVSYDPTREFYDEFNKQFAANWKQKTGQDLSVTQSHGGSGKQARSVIDGLKADVVTLALAYDIDVIAEKGKLLSTDWQKEFPHESTPMTSTIVFLVRKDNPKHIKDWDDLVRSDVKVITPNPKTSGGARWNYLAAWAYAKQANNGDEAKIKEYIGNLFKNVPVLDTGARGATTTFVQRGIGDVLIAWESEALLAQQQSGKGQFTVIRPSISIEAEPPVAVVEKNAVRKGSLDVAKAYLQYLYTPEAQELAAKYFYRPTDESILAKHKDIFPEMKLVTVADFGGWKEAQKTHFNDGGTFDQIYSK